MNALGFPSVEHLRQECEIRFEYCPRWGPLFTHFLGPVLPNNFTYICK
jgi:hypothetical protein